MSFILDALKKSESDRQRKNGPALFEVKVAPPRTHLPAWAIAIAALLVVNLGIVMWMVMRHPGRAGAVAESAAGAAAAAAATASTSGAPGPAAAPAAASPAAPVASAPMPPQAATQSAAPPTALASASGSTATLSTTVANGVAPPPAPAGASPAAAAPAAPDGANPDDYAPAEDAPASAPASGLFSSGRVRRGTAAGVPLYQDAAATPGTQIPQLRLDLHVFAVRAQDRFVMINMHKVHEGDTLPEGVHVDNITPEGAVLSYNGSRFLLPRE
jgi:general secretion pathway protein B